MAEVPQTQISQPHLQRQFTNTRQQSPASAIRPKTGARAGGDQEEDLVRILGLPTLPAATLGKQEPRLNALSARETAIAVRETLAQPSTKAMAIQAGRGLALMRSFTGYLLN